MTFKLVTIVNPMLPNKDNRLIVYVNIIHKINA